MARKVIKMVYKFETDKAELFASKLSKNGYRLFIMIDNENKTFIYGQSHSTVVNIYSAGYINSDSMLQRDIKSVLNHVESDGYHRMSSEDYYAYLEWKRENAKA